MSPKWALLASAIVATSPWWLYHVRCFTAEVPSALAIIGFVAVRVEPRDGGREWWAGVLAVVCYLLPAASLVGPEKFSGDSQ